MSKRLKHVNINAPVPVRTLTPPIYGEKLNVEMCTGDILKCLNRRARVEEILPDNSTIRLNFSNYNTDNYVEVEETNNEDNTNEIIEQVPEMIPEFSEDENEKTQVVETDNETDVEETNLDECDSTSNTVITGVKNDGDVKIYTNHNNHHNKKKKH